MEKKTFAPNARIALSTHNGNKRIVNSSNDTHVRSMLTLELLSNHRSEIQVFRVPFKSSFFYRRSVFSPFSVKRESWVSTFCFAVVSTL